MSPGHHTTWSPCPTAPATKSDLQNCLWFWPTPANVLATCRECHACHADEKVPEVLHLSCKTTFQTSKCPICPTPATKMDIAQKRTPRAGKTRPYETSKIDNRFPRASAVKMHMVRVMLLEGPPRLQADIGEQLSHCSFIQFSASLRKQNRWCCKLAFLFGKDASVCQTDGRRNWKRPILGIHLFDFARTSRVLLQTMRTLICKRPRLWCGLRWEPHNQSPFPDNQ